MAGPVRERVTAADRRHFDFVQTLLRISDELTEEETANVKLFCLHLIPKGQAARLRRAVDVFHKLIELGKIDPENLDFLEELLERMGRQDLIRDVLRQFQPPDREIPENPELEPETPEPQSENPELQPKNPELEPENPELEPENLELEPENPELQLENPEQLPENPELEPENPEPQPGTSQEGANEEGNAMSNIYVVVRGQMRMIQETLNRLRNSIARLIGTRRSEVKFRGYKKHGSILVHFSIPRENTAVLRLMADNSDPRLVFMGMESLQIDAGVPVKLRQEALLYDVKRHLPVDDIEVGCSTRKKQQRAPRSWTRLWALNLFSDALPLHLQVAASLEYQGFSYSLVRALAERDRLREHQMKRAVHNLRKAEVESNALRQKAEVDSNTLMTLRSKLNIAENRLKEALETNAVLEEKLQQAQEYTEKAARQVATHVTEYRGEKPPAGWSQEYRGEKPPGGWPAQVEKADAATHGPLADTEGTAGRPEHGDKVGEEWPVLEEKEEDKEEDKEDDKEEDKEDEDKEDEDKMTTLQDSGNESKDTGATDQERHQAGVEGAAPRTAGDVEQGKVTFGGTGTEPGKFRSALGVVMSPSNEIFVADLSNRRVQVHNIEGGYLRHFPTVVPGTGNKDMAPYDVSLDSNGTLWVVGNGEAADHVVQYSTDGTAMARFQLRQSEYFRGIAVDMRTNHILVTGADRGEVEVFRPDGSLVRRFGHPGGEMRNPRYITVDGEGNILVSDWDSHYVYVYDESGKLLINFGGEGYVEGQLWEPRGICTDRAGNIIVVDGAKQRVQILTRHGEYLRSIRTESAPHCLAVGPEGQLVVTSWMDDTVTVFPNY